jgi:glutamate 5-kinase
MKILLLNYHTMKQQIVKIGSNAITQNGVLDEAVIEQTVAGIQYAYSKDIITVLVTSWAVALWREYLWANRDTSIDAVSYKQMCSWSGQAILMAKYKDEFAKYWLKVAQILVTQDTFKNQQNMDSLMAVITGYLKMWIIPIINENDVLSKEELIFSDNDILATMIALSLKIEQVIFLSNVTGLYTAHPDKWWVLLERVTEITQEIRGMVDAE